MNSLSSNFYATSEISYATVAAVPGYTGQVIYSKSSPFCSLEERINYFRLKTLEQNLLKKLQNKRINLGGKFKLIIPKIVITPPPKEKVEKQPKRKNVVVKQPAKPVYTGYEHLFQRDEMTPGVVRATSKKQVKVRSQTLREDIRPLQNYSEENFVQISNNLFDEQRERTKFDFFAAITRKTTVLAEAIIAGFMKMYQKKDSNFLYKLKSALEASKELLVPQMDPQETQHGQTKVKVDVKENVVIEDQKAVSHNVPTTAVNKGFSAMSSATEVQTLKHLSSRWLKLKDNILWDAAYPFNKLITTIDLPRKAIRDNLNSPNVMPFLIHRYFRTNLKLKFVLNANKFQVGQLQVSWFYNSSENLYYPTYNSVYSASQRNHVILDAGSNNSAEMLVPYWSYRSKLSCKLTASEVLHNSKSDILGSLQFRVLSPLSSPDTVAKSCTVTVYVSFENPEFSGLIDKSIDEEHIQPQMEELDLITNTAERVLNIINPPQNRDNPPISKLPVTVQPMASNSFGVMSNQNENIRVMRTDPLCQTPGVCDAEGKEDVFSQILDRWSLLNKFQWSNSDAAGKQLFSMPAMPVLSDGYYNVERFKDTQYLWLPIISIISSMFCYWRGEIELRFDFVASQFHTGRLQFSQVPGYQKKTVDIEVAKNSNNQIVDLSDGKQATFSLQYYNCVPYDRVNKNPSISKDVDPLSFFFIHVVNPLVPMDNVSSKIDVLIYIRAGKTFELSIPRPCGLTTPFNKIVFPSKESAYVSTDWPQMFTSGSRQFPQSGGKQALSFFDSETTDYFTQFTNFKFGKVYVIPVEKFKHPRLGSIYFRVQYYVNSNTLASVKFFCRAFEYPQYPVAVLFVDKAKASSYAKAPGHIDDALSYADKQGPWAEYSTDGTTWAQISRTDLPLISFAYEEPSVDFEFLFPQMDDQFSETTSSISLDKPAASTKQGNLVFGESVISGKQYCRRWQPLGCFNYKNEKSQYSCLSKVPPTFKIHLHPLKVLGSDKSTAVDDRDNRVREGNISILSSGFAGYRGSLRVRVIISSKNLNKVNWCVVHKFDEPANFGQPSVISAPNVFGKFDDYLNSAYAMEFQSAAVNPVLEVEVPFYRYGEYNYMMPTSESKILEDFSSLGYLYCYVTGVAKDDYIGIDVFYSVGDDFVFSNFQGFPAMYFLDEFPDTPVPQMDDSVIESGIDVLSLLNVISPNLFRTIHDVIFYNLDKMENFELLSWIWSLEDSYYFDYIHRYKEIPAKCYCVGLPRERLIANLIYDLNHISSCDEIYAPCSCGINKYTHDPFVIRPEGIEWCYCVKSRERDGCDCVFDFDFTIKGYEGFKGKSWLRYPLRWDMRKSQRYFDHYIDDCLPIHNCLKYYAQWNIQNYLFIQDTWPEFDYLDYFEPSLFEEVEPQMEYIKSFFSCPKKLGDMCDAFKSASQTVSDKFCSAISSLTEGISNITNSSFVTKGIDSFSSLLSNCKSFAFNLLSQLMHIINSPTKATVFIAIITLMSYLFNERVVALFSKIKESLNKVWEYFFGSRNKQTTSEENLTGHIDETESVVADFASLLWAIAGTIIGFVIEKPKNMLQFTAGLFSKSALMFRSHVFGIKFFTSFFKVFKNIWDWVNKKLGRSSSIYNVIKDSDHLKTWLVMVETLVAQENRELCYTNKTWASKVFESYVIGKLIYASAVDSQKNLRPDLYRVICDSFKNIKELSSELLHKGYVPSIRQEPFVIWISGPPGTGKTTFLNDLIFSLATKYNIEPAYYNHCSGDKYYDGLVDQDIVVLDDFLSTVDQNFAETIAQFQQMCNDSFLSLPRANCPDKTRVDKFKFLIITSNKERFDSGISNIIRDEEAFNRRRKLIINLKFKDESGKVLEDSKQNTYYKNYLPDINGTCGKKRCADLSHLEIRLSTNDEDYLIVKNKDELIEKVLFHSEIHNVAASKKYLARLKEYERCVNVAATDSYSFSEFFKNIANSHRLSQIDLTDEMSWLSQTLMKKYVEESVEEPTPSQSVDQQCADSLSELADKEKIEGHMEGSSNSEESVFRNLIKTQIEKHGAILEQDPEYILEKNKMEFKFEVNGFENKFCWPFEQSDGTLELDKALSEEKNIRVPILNNPFSSRLNWCSHRNFDFSKCLIFKMKPETCAKIHKNEINVRNYRRYLFIQADNVTSEGCVAACYDAVCVDANGNLLPGCAFIDMDSKCVGTIDQKNDVLPMLGNDTVKIFKYPFVNIAALNSFHSMSLALEMKGINLYTLMREKPLEAERYYPVAMYNTIVKQHLPKPLSSARQLEVKMLNFICKVVTLGFEKDLIEVDGVKHVAGTKINPFMSNNFVEVKRERGLIFDRVTTQRFDGDHVVQKESICVSSHIKVLSIIGALIALCAYILWFLDLISFYLTFGSLLMPEVRVPQVGTSGDFKTSSSGDVVRAIKLVSSSGQLEEDFNVVLPSNSSNNSTEGILNNIKKNIMYMCLVERDGKDIIIRKQGRCLGLYMNKLLAQTHYLDVFKHDLISNPNLEFCLYSKNPKLFYFVNIKHLEIEEYESGGFCVVNLPKNFPLFKNIVKYMPHEGAIKFPTKLTLFEFNIEEDKQTNLDVVFNHSIKRQVHAKGAMQGWEMTQYFRYRYGKAGVCGAVLMDLNSSHPLVGMHTCGDEHLNVGYSELLLQEMFKSSEPAVEMVTPHLHETGMFQPPENCQILGYVNHEDTVITPRKTQIIPSMLFGEWENETEPAPLDVTDPRLPENCSPLHEGVKKRCDNIIPFNNNDLKIALDDYRNKILTKCKPIVTPCIPLSMPDVVLGIENVPYIDPLVLSTSEGYPWVKSRPQGATDKRWLFDINNNTREIKIFKGLSDVLDLHESFRDRNIVPFSCYTACLKDARILKSKVSVPGKTRLFEMSPIELTLAQRKYFLPFYASYQSQRFDLEHTIGINPNSKEWSVLAEKLLEKGQNILAGDYSSYGPKASIDVLHSLIDISIEWNKNVGYTDYQIRQCEGLKYQILNAPVIVKDCLIRFLNGLPSGNCATVILNSMLNSVYIRLAWLDIMRNTEFHGMKAMADNIFFVSNGDDIIISVSDDVIDKFNNLALEKFFKKHNIKFTNSKKDMDNVPYEVIEDVQYLKCGFARHPSRPLWLAPLEWTSVKETPLWIWKKGLNPMEATAQNVDQALRLCFGHGPDSFYLFSSFLLRACSKVGISISLPTWDQLDVMCYEKNIVIVYM